eukprot:8358035-Heterocapsa_arctica.AAC.1
MALPSELRTQQNKFSIINKYNILVRKGKEYSVEGLRLKEVVSDCFHGGHYNTGGVGLEYES